MVTLLQVTWSGGATQRCDAKCHNATKQGCRCPCHGRFHGKQEGSLSFNAAVLEHAEQLLAELGQLEQAGAVWIDACRARPNEPLLRRPKGKARVYQENLFAELGFPINPAGRLLRG